MTRNVRKVLTGDELLAKVDRWLETFPEPPSIFDVARTRDADLLAGFVLRGFRAAARQAVLEKISRYAGGVPLRGRGDQGRAVARLFAHLVKEWSLNSHEQSALLGFQGNKSLNRFRASKDSEVEIEVVERVSYLLDIFIAATALLSDPSRAAEWLRKPNSTAFFNGETPLTTMMRDLDQLRLVKRYLQAEAWGG